MGNPVGIPIARTTTRSPRPGPVLWSFGGMEIDKDGKTVEINSPATVQTIEWYQKMYKDCMEPEVLSWSDASNNESIQQGKAGWITIR
jgi:multiple sugar transport system substrate-binding protein